MKEPDLEKALCDYLQLDGWRVLKPASGHALFLRFQCDQCAHEDCERCLPAKADLPGPWRTWTQVLMIEFKRRRLASHGERVYGAMTLIAGVDFRPTLDGFVFWYQQSGLLRRREILKRNFRFITQTNANQRG